MRVKSLDVLDVLECYANETKGIKRTFDREVAENDLVEVLSCPDKNLIVNEEFGRIKGLAVISVCSQFIKEKYGCINVFYVLPQYRGQGIGRQLTKDCLNWFKEQGCSLVVADSLGKVGQDRLFINLLKKNGFKPEAITLVKDISNG